MVYIVYKHKHGDFCDMRMKKQSENCLIFSYTYTYTARNSPCDSGIVTHTIIVEPCKESFVKVESLNNDNFIKNDIIPSAPRETEIEDPQRIIEFSMDMNDEYLKDSSNQVNID